MGKLCKLPTKADSTTKRHELRQRVSVVTQSREHTMIEKENVQMHFFLLSLSFVSPKSGLWDSFPFPDGAQSLQLFSIRGTNSAKINF